MVSDSVLVDRLRELLQTSDLYTTTAAALRRALEEEFDIDLSDRKTFIRKQIEAFIDERAENDGADDNAEEKEEGVEESNGERSEKGRSDKVDDAVEKRGGALNFIKPCRLSPQIQTLVGVAELARPEVVKRIWAYIREKDLQDPKNRRKILCDKTLRAIFHVKSIDSFQMSKALSEHIWHPNKKVSAKSSQKKRQRKQGREGENSSLELGIDLSNHKTFIRKQIEVFIDKRTENDGVNDNAEEVKKSDGERSEKGRSDKVDDALEKRGRALNVIKPCGLSPQLQTFVGVAELSGPEVVKRIWAYIREKDLQDPTNKQKILCDETLRAIFRVKSIDMFEMAKALSEHIWYLNKKGPVKSSQKKRQRKQGREGSNEPKGKRQKARSSGLLSPLPLSDALVKFLDTGESVLSWADVTKKMWDYIKQKNLQDPSDKRRILCDQRLKELFGVDSFTGFTVSKLLATHVIKAEQ